MKKIKFSKKGDSTLLKELMYLAVGITALFVILSNGGPLIMGLFYDTPDKLSVNNFERLVTEIRSALIEYSDWEKEGTINERIQGFRRSVPLNFDEALGIKFYNPQDNMPTKCRKRNLPCVCIAYFEKFERNEEVYRCRNIEQNVDFLFDYYQRNSGQGNLIRGQGIGSFELSFDTSGDNTLVLKLRSNFDVVEDLYVDFQNICNEQCDYRAWDGESIFPQKTPFGKVLIDDTLNSLEPMGLVKPNTIITAPYKSIVYFNQINQDIQAANEHGQDVYSKIHYAIDIVPNYVNYDQTVSDDLTNFRVGRPIQEKAVFYATCSGTVTHSDISGLSGAYYIKINCDDGIHAVEYFHNDVHFVKSGDVVDYGQPIGIMGNTGFSSTGSHIHYVVKKNSDPINPLFFIDDSYFYQRNRNNYEREASYQLISCNSESENDVCVIEAFRMIDSGYLISEELVRDLDLPDGYLASQEITETPT